MTWKNKLRNKSCRKELFMAYGQILLGCIIGGAAYPMFLVPNNIAPGGLTGVATVLNYLVQVPVGLTSMLMNVPLFIIGFKAMGRVFVLRSLVAVGERLSGVSYGADAASDLALRIIADHSRSVTFNGH